MDGSILEAACFGEGIMKTMSKEQTIKDRECDGVMKRAIISILILMCALVLLLPQGMANAEAGLIWSDEQPAAPVDQIDQGAVVHTLTSDAVFVSSDAVECVCCEHCPTCYDQETGERTGTYCKCVDEHGNYLGCGCECPFEINILDEDFLEKLNASHYIYDADGNVLSDRDIWYQTYQEAVAPEGQRLQLQEGQDLAAHLQGYSDITGLMENGGLFVDCGGLCHLDMPMMMNAIMPLSASGPIWYDGSTASPSNAFAEKGWICQDWADVRAVLTGTTSTFPSAYASAKAKESGYNQWWYKTDNTVQMRRIYLVNSVTATSNITSATDTGKVQIVCYDPRTVSGEAAIRNPANWKTLTLNNYKMTGRTGDTFLSLAFGHYTTSHTSGYFMQPGATGKKEMELYNANYTGGPLADTGTTSNSSRVIIDNSTVTINAGKLCRAVTLDINPWTLDGYTSITRNGIAGELIEWVQYGSTGGKQGIRFGEWSGSGTLDINLGGAGHLFGSSAGTDTTMWMLASTGGRTQAVSRAHFILRGIGDAGIGLLSAPGALKSVSFAAGGSFTVTPPLVAGTTDQYVGEHAVPAAGYAFVDLPMLGGVEPFDILIHNTNAQRTTLKTINALVVQSNSTMIVRSIGGSNNAITAPGIVVHDNSTTWIESRASRDYFTDTDPMVRVQNQASLTVPATATMTLWADIGSGSVIDRTTSTGVPSLSVAGEMYVMHSQNGNTGGAKDSIYIVGNAAVASGGLLKMTQSPRTDYGSPAPTMYNGHMLRAGDVTVAAGGVLETDKGGTSATGDSVRAENITINGTLIANHFAGDSALYAGGDITFGANSTATIDISPKIENGTRASVYAGGALYVQAGADVLVKTSGNLAYVLNHPVIQTVGDAEILGKLTLTLPDFLASGSGGMKIGQKLSVGSAGILKATLSGDESINGAIAADAVQVNGGGLIDLNTTARNMYNRTPGLSAASLIHVFENGTINVNYNGLTNAQSSGGAGIKSKALACEGTINVVHQSGGWAVSGEDVAAVEVTNQTLVNTTGTMTITRKGRSPALGTIYSRGYGLVSGSVDVYGVRPGGLYVYAQDYADTAVYTTGKVTVGAGGYMYAEKAAGSATATGSGVESNTVEVIGTLDIDVLNGRNGLRINGTQDTSTCIVRANGLLDINVSGDVNNQGNPLWARSAQVGVGGEIVITQTAGNEAICLQDGRGGLDVLGGTVTVTRASAAVGSDTDAMLISGLVIQEGGNVTMDLKAGHDGINTTRAVDQFDRGSVFIILGGHLTINQGSDSTASSTGTAVNTGTFMTDASVSTVSLKQVSAAADANVIHALGITLGQATTTDITQLSSGSHAVWVEGDSDGNNTIQTIGNTTITKQGGTGNAIRAGRVLVGIDSLTSSNALLTIHQSAGADTVYLTGAYENQMTVGAGTTVNIEKDGTAQNAVISGDVIVFWVNTSGNLRISQQTGTATFENIRICNTLLSGDVSIIRNVNDNRAVFDFAHGAPSIEQDQLVLYGRSVYIENAGGAMVAAGQYPLEVNLWTQALNYKHSGRAEYIWNNSAMGMYVAITNITGGSMGPVTTSVLSDSNSGVGPNMPAMSPTTLNILSTTFEYYRAGFFAPFTIDAPKKGDTKISGTMGSNVVSGEAYEYTIPQTGTLTQRQGPFAITGAGPYSVTANALDPNRSQVYVLAVDANALKAWERADVQGWVALTADDTLKFKDTNRLYDGIIYRADTSTDWKLTVLDNRGYMDGSTWVGGPGGWRVNVKVSGLFTNVAAPYDTLATSYMFLRRDSQLDMTFTTTDQLFHNQTTGMDTSATQKVFQWPAEEGILFKQGYYDGVANCEYQTTITWTLVQ